MIEYSDRPVGVIGLLSIKDKAAEYYVTLGEIAYKGIAKEATRQIIQYGFAVLGLEQIYLYTEVENVAAQHLFERCGFHKKGISLKSGMNRSELVDRYYYVVTREDMMAESNNSIIRGGYSSVNISMDSSRLVA